MEDNVIRNLGVQPIAEVMAKEGLKAHDLVSASTKQLTHKVVSRACKGRRLTDNSKLKVLEAINLASGKDYGLSDLFNY